MDKDSAPPNASLPPLPPAKDPQPLTGPAPDEHQMSVGLRLGIYLFPVLFCYFALSFVIGAFVNVPENSAAYPFAVFVQELLLFLIVYLPACLMARLENRPVGVYGLPVHGFLDRKSVV